MFKKILIANRGENAVRVARTCERMGITTIAIHSDVDWDSLHVEICKESRCIGSAEIENSYLNHQAIIEAAKDASAEAIHPGTGPLSEQPSFAKKVKEAGLVFIGPDADALENYSNRLRMRQSALNAGIRLLPASDVFSLDDENIQSIAENMEYPLVLKSTTRSDDIPIQRVHSTEELLEAIRKQRNNGLENLEYYLEPFIEKSRQIEIQIVADINGTCVAIGDRECSIQRNFDKIMEESPAPAFISMLTGSRKRSMLWEMASQMGKELNYQGLGTVKFLADVENRFYFLGFTPRLQTEHTVTELCTGLDLVELQVRIRDGEKVPESVLRAEPSGHAIQARIRAEDPDNNFVKCVGRIKELRWPTLAPRKFRIESGIARKIEVTVHDDPLIAKVVGYGPTRHQAALTLDRILAQTVIHPLKTNIAFLRKIIENESFQAGQYDMSICETLINGGDKEGKEE